MRLLKRRRPRPGSEPAQRGGEYASYMTSSKHVARLREELTEIAHPFLAAHGIAAAGTTCAPVRSLIDEFFDLYPTRPVEDNVKGSRFHNGFWLFLAARSLVPALIERASSRPRGAEPVHAGAAERRRPRPVANGRPGVHRRSARFIERGSIGRSATRRGGSTTPGEPARRRGSAG